MNIHQWNMIKFIKYFNEQVEKQHPVFIILLLFFSFLGSNIYYFLTFDYINKLQDSRPFASPRTDSNLLFSTNLITLKGDPLAGTKPEVILKERLAEDSRPETEKDAMGDCDFWRKQAEVNDSLLARHKANKECVNAFLGLQ